MITTDQWKKQILSGEERDVIFGITYRNSLNSYPRVVSAKGNTSSNHGDFFGNRYEKYQFINTWRYVPLVKTIYWWRSRDELEKEDSLAIEATTEHLKEKYKETPQYNKVIQWATWDEKNPFSKKSLMATANLYITHNDTDFGSDEFGSPKLPTFKQWLKYHTQGD